MENLNEVVTETKEKTKLNGNGSGEKPAVNEEEKPVKEKINS